MSKLIEQYKVDQQEFVNARERGDSADELKVWLIEEYKVPFSKVPALYKELGGPTQKRGFRAAFYEALKVAPMDAAEVQLYVEAHGSNNDVKHLTHYQGIAELANAIHNK